MIPKPRVNLLLYHGAFAPYAHGREDAVRTARHATAAAATTPAGNAGNDAPRAVTASAGAEDANQPRPSSLSVADLRRGDAAVEPSPAARPPPPPAYTRPPYYAWADLLRRTFAIDVLVCAGCGGRLRLLATITDEQVIQRILGHLGLPSEIREPAPARPSGWWFDLSSPRRC